MRRLIAILLLGFLGSSAAFAQDERPTEDIARWGPDGVYVFVSDVGLSPEAPHEGRVGAIVYRREDGEDDFEEIARVRRPSTLEAFAERTTDDIVEGLREAAEVETDDELWRFVQDRPALEEYGWMAMDKALWPALGTAYLDTEVEDAPEGSRYTYEVRYQMEDGTVEEGLRSTVEIGAAPAIQRPQLARRIEQDSLVGAEWTAPVESSEDAIFARIYRQRGEDGRFEQLSDALLAVRNDSLITYRWEETAVPERAYRYVIEPIDIVGNAGARSDTVTALSVDFDKIPLVGAVAARDTTRGIHLSWEAIPDKPYLVGVEIQRSRNATTGYVVLDTVSTNTAEYLDTRLLPNQTYYYRFRTVTLRGESTLPSAVASAAHRNASQPPSPPSNLQAEPDGAHIRLTWNDVAEPDLFGYYVYRGTSRDDSLAVVSRAITDSTSFVDTSAVLDGRTNYVYAVRAVNQSDMRSELSNVAVARPDRPVRPARPLGIRGYAEQNRIRLSWEDARNRDEAVVGYHLYRSTEPVEAPEEGRSAQEMANEIGMERLTAEPLVAPAYDDRDVDGGTTYYYAVSSVDIYGVESSLSPAADFAPVSPGLRPPSRVGVRSVSAGVEVRWSETRQEAATGYRVYRRQRDGTPEVVAELGRDETTFVDPDVQSDVLYLYSVRTIADGRQGGRSREQPIRSR